MFYISDLSRRIIFLWKDLDTNIRVNETVWTLYEMQGKHKMTIYCLKSHSGFENGFFRALSAFGSSASDTMHTN